MKGNDTYSYICDCGSLRIGNDRFQFLIPNGYGDGCFEIKYIDGPGAVNKDDWNFISTFNGEDINVYYYDCPNSKFGNEILFTLDKGTYAVYNFDGDMLIEKWRD